ncbi:MAG TPA: hypothetical protein VGL61_31675 [Kofleriaceae bacterium]|jgi:hypothetical protein
MLRFAAIALLLGACRPLPEDDVAQPPFNNQDLDAGQCEPGALQIAAPVAGEHYDKSLDVLVDESALWHDISVTITDDVGDLYDPTAASTQPYPADAGIWSNRDTYHFELAASTRYTLAASHCTTYESVAFFTSP